MMPASISATGEISALFVPCHGIFDIGRYPGGRNAHDDKLAHALEAANIAAFVTPDVMQSKYGKLLLNLGNIVDAAFGPTADPKRFNASLRAEAEAVYKAIGISWKDLSAADPRRDQLMRYQSIEGVERPGSSTTQSLARGADSIETDYLNGEIVLLGRMHGVPVAVNTYFIELSLRMLRDKLKPGEVSVAQAEAELTALGVVLGT